MSDFLATKPLDVLLAEAQDESGTSLRRVLGPINLITLGIGAIIGAGIFVVTGTVAATLTGPAIVLSFLLAGSGCLFAGLCYAEFASLIPIAGSAYTYGYATLGEIFAWIIGWDLVIEYAKRLRNGAVFKRLGFLASRLLGDAHPLAIACHAHLTNGNAQLDPELRGDRLMTRWRLFVPGSLTIESNRG